MYEKFFKRLIDVVLSAIGLLVLSGVYLLIAVAVVLDDPGPIFLSKNEWVKVKSIFHCINSVP